MDDIQKNPVYQLGRLGPTDQIMARFGQAKLGRSSLSDQKMARFGQAKLGRLSPADQKMARLLGTKIRKDAGWEIPSTGPTQG